MQFLVLGEKICFVDIDKYANLDPVEVEKIIQLKKKKKSIYNNCYGLLVIPQIGKIY